MSILEEVRQTIQNGDGVQSLQLNFAKLNIGRFTPEIKKMIQKCEKLEILMLSNCNLNSLDNLPDLDLVAIDLTQNNLSDSQLQKLTKYKNLSQIILNENKIKNLEGIRSLAPLQNLEQIDFSDNPITQIANYRQLIWEILPQLQVLDRYDREGVEQVDSQSENLEDDDFNEDDNQYEEEEDEENSDEQDDDGDYNEEEKSQEQPQKKTKR